MNLLIKNCSLYNKTGNFSILLNDKKIEKIEKSKENELHKIKDIKVLDVDKRIVIPGLIDTHLQGAGGFDILDNDQEGLEVISKTLAKNGITSFLATTVIKPSINSEHIKKVNRFIEKTPVGAKCLGFHLEGPFINPQKIGGLNSDGIHEPSKEMLKEIFELCEGNLKIMTIAPELQGNLDLIKLLVKRNVVASLGHTDARYEQVIEGFCAGITHCTHLFNAMPPLHHRNPGTIAAVINQRDVFAEVISDGHHLSPHVVRLLHNALVREKIICITDGVQGIGLPEGKYIYNDKEYISKDGAARYLDGTLIGTTVSLLEIVLRYKEFTSSTFEEAINTGSLNPAKVLGLEDQLGSLAEGKIADIVILDHDFSVFATIIDGKLIYSKNQI